MREFDIRMKKFGWSNIVLIHQIENPSYEKYRTAVEYSLLNAAKPIGVATYRTVRDPPEDLNAMPSAPEEIETLTEAAE